MNTNKKPTLLVTGAGGQLGRRVVELLLDDAAGPVIATTRNPEKLSSLAARGAEVRKADFEDPHSLEAAFAGGERMLLISTSALAPAGLRLSQHRAAVKAAVAAGIEHVVYTSGPAPYPVEGGALIDDHFWTEQALFASPLEWTIMRHFLYMDSLLNSLPSAVASGRSRLLGRRERDELRGARGLRSRRCGGARVRLPRAANSRYHGPEGGDAGRDCRARQRANGARGSPHRRFGRRGARRIGERRHAAVRGRCRGAIQSRPRAGLPLDRESCRRRAHGSGAHVRPRVPDAASSGTRARPRLSERGQVRAVVAYAARNPPSGSPPSRSSASS